MLAGLGLEFSEAKTRITHLSEGIDFLGFHIQWRQQRGSGKWYCMIFIADKSFAKIKQTIRTLDPAPVPSPADGGDHRGQRGTARLDVLLPPRDRRATFLLPQVLHLETDRGLATRAAPLELDQGQTVAPTPRWELENHCDRGCCALRSDPRSYRALLVSRHPHPQPL